MNKVRAHALKKGFTLIEILVAIAILAILGTLIVTIFSRTLKGSNKSQILGVIKQNGQAVLELMDKTIRNADNIVCYTTSTIVVIKNGTYYRFKFTPKTDTSNGQITEDFPIQPTQAGTVDKTKIKIFVDNVCTDDPGTDTSPVDSFQVLTDTNTQTGVSITNTPPFFARNRQAGTKDIMTIKFQLEPGINAPPSLRGQISPVDFETTIQLR